MANIPRPSVIQVAQEEAAIPIPERVTIALAALAETAREGLLAFSVGLGLAVVGEIFEEEVTQLVGPRGKHSQDRQAYRHGQEERQLTLGGRRVTVHKPRARTKAGEEVELESYRLFASRDLLTQAALDRMLAGLSTRRYRTGLEPVGKKVEPKATSRSSISRRFVAGTKRKLAELFGRDLSQLDLLAIFIDGIETADHTIVVALGVDADGHKHPLGLWEGSTENKTVCRALLNNLVERGLDTERPILAVIDGGKAIRAALKAAFGDRVLIGRCRAHKRRNVLDHLPEDQRTFIGRKLDRAWRETDAGKAEQELKALAKQLETDHPGAAASLREGLEETLTVTRLGLSPSLMRTFKSTNPIESMISVARTVTDNVKRWRNGAMILRWTAAGVLEAEKQFRRVNGHRDLQLLRFALDRSLPPAEDSLSATVA
jgi:putative transposase